MSTPVIGAVDAPAGRRRVMIAAAVAVMIGALVVVAQVRTDDEDRAVAAAEAAIQRAADVGGPRGFVSTNPVPLLQGDPPAHRHEARQRLDVGIAEDRGLASGFVTAWSTTVPRASSPETPCEALADWVRRMFGKPDSEMGQACRTAVREQPGGGEGVFASVAGEFTAEGRYSAGASTRSLADVGTELSVVLSFEPPLDAH